MDNTGFETIFKYLDSSLITFITFFQDNDNWQEEYYSYAERLIKSEKRVHKFNNFIQTYNLQEHEKNLIFFARYYIELFWRIQGEKQSITRLYNRRTENQTILKVLDLLSKNQCTEIRFISNTDSIKITSENHIDIIKELLLAENLELPYGLSGSNILGYTNDKIDEILNSKKQYYNDSRIYESKFADELKPLYEYLVNETSIAELPKSSIKKDKTQYTAINNFLNSILEKNPFLCYKHDYFKDHF